MREERKSKPFWIIIEGELVYRTGYECKGSPGYWWVPSLGFSGAEGFSLFEKKEDAKAAARMQLEKQITSLKAKLEKLESE